MFARRTQRSIAIPTQRDRRSPAGVPAVAATCPHRPRPKALIARCFTIQLLGFFATAIATADLWPVGQLLGMLGVVYLTSSTLLPTPRCGCVRR